MSPQQKYLKTVNSSNSIKDINDSVINYLIMANWIAIYFNKFCGMIHYGVFLTKNDWPTIAENEYFKKEYLPN